MCMYGDLHPPLWECHAVLAFRARDACLAAPHRTALHRRPRTATVASRQHGCLHPVVSTLAAGAGNQACRALVAKRACKW